MGFVGRWLSDAVRLALALGVAIAAAQLPALTGEYTAALLQVSNDARRDIDQREQAAREYYHLVAATDAAIVAALAAPEPSNAETLGRSLGRWTVLRAAYDRIQASLPLLRPPVAVADALDDADGAKRSVLRTTFATHVTQIAFSSEAASYGLAGLVAGSFLAEMALSLAKAAFGGRRRAHGSR